MSNYIAYCGLYCGGCLCNIARETSTVEEFAKKLNKPVEQLICPDCKVAKHPDCSFVVCCEAKGYETCAECEEMPCEELTRFANNGREHCAMTIENLKRIREIGLDDWLLEQKQAYTCPTCGARTGWSYKKCDRSTWKM